MTRLPHLNRNLWLLVQKTFHLFQTNPLLLASPMESRYFSSLNFYHLEYSQKAPIDDGASSLMDVDPIPIITNVPVGSAPDPAPVICLSYSLVPGLDTTSQSYQKAVATLGKQQTKMVPIAKSVPLISVLDRGMTVYDIIITCLNFDFSQTSLSVPLRIPIPKPSKDLVISLTTP